MRVRFFAVALSATVAMLVAAPAAMADDVPCPGVLAGPVNGNVVVLEGTFCTLTAAQVNGNVIVRTRAVLIAQNSSIVGNVDSTKASTFTDLRGGNTVQGDVVIKGNTVVNDICGNELRQNYQQEEAPGGTRFGTDSPFCPALPNRVGQNVKVEKNGSVQGVSGNTIGANLQVFDNIGSRTINRNNVRQDLQLFKNTGPSSVLNNVIGENLQCFDNAPPPVSAGNAAEQRQGQCLN